MVITAVVALAAFCVAIWSARSAAKSARNSKLSADTAVAALKGQQDERHRSLDPGSPGVMKAVRENSANLGGTAMGEITVGKDYRVVAVRWLRGGGSVEFRPVDGHIRRNKPWRFPIEDMSIDRNDLDTSQIEFRFCPPAEGAPVQPWRCPCGADDQFTAESGHWYWTVDVAPPPRRGRLLA